MAQAACEATPQACPQTLLCSEGGVMRPHEKVPGVTDAMLKAKIRNAYSRKPMSYEPQLSCDR
jgi:hypothetical protein